MMSSNYITIASHYDFSLVVIDALKGLIKPGDILIDVNNNTTVIVGVERPTEDRLVITLLADNQRESISFILDSWMLSPSFLFDDNINAIKSKGKQQVWESVERWIKRGVFIAFVEKDIKKHLLPWSQKWIFEFRGKEYTVTDIYTSPKDDACFIDMVEHGNEKKGEPITIGEIFDISDFVFASKYYEAWKKKFQGTRVRRKETQGIQHELRIGEK